MQDTERDERKIELVEAGQVSVGEFIIDVDNDELTTTDAISENYLWSEQDWQHVVGRKGHADVGQFVLAMYNGELYTTGTASWDRKVWRLIHADTGLPVTQDPADSD